MGIIKSNVEILLSAKKREVSFTNTATLGHLKWYVSDRELLQAGDSYDVDVSLVREKLKSSKYSDIFFHDILGTRNLTIIDNSSYEGAGVTLDLNQPIPQKMEQAFDVVFDSGTLEHVFNFPTALANCMKMVKVNGTLFICTPANNYLGHGFYQFSPELFFRVFQRENGFSLTNIVLIKHPYPGAELSSHQELYKAIDPKEIGQRAMFVGNSPVLLMIEAKRISDSPVFATYPQQSDYAKIWGDFLSKSDNQNKSINTKSFWEILKKILGGFPKIIQNFVWGHYQKMIYSIKNKKFFQRLKKF